MNYLRKKLQGLRMCADFKGYLREVTGAPPLTLTDCMGSDLVSLSVTGNAVQDGTPSPDAPVEVQGCGEKTGNLFSTDENDWQTGLYKYYKIPVEGSTTLQVKLKDGKSIPENLFIGYTDGGADATGGVTWVIAEGSYVNTNTRNSTFRYISIYHPTLFDEVIDAFDIMLVKGSYTADTMPPFEPYGYKVPVEVGGVNLFDVSRHTGFDGNSVTITNTSGANWQGRAFDIDYAVEFGKTYTYSVDYVIDNAADYSTIRFGYMTANAYTVVTIGDIIAIHGSGTFVHTVTTPESIDNFDRFVLYANSSGGNPAVGDKITISNIQIIKGAYTADTMPAYEPYREPQTVNVYTDKPLYGQDGEAWSEVVYDGTEDWYATAAAQDGQINYFVVGPRLNIGAVGPKNSMCTYFPKSTSTSSSLTELNTFKLYGFSNYTSWVGVRVSTIDYPTVDDWKAFLQAQCAAGTPLKIYAPTEESARAETTAPTYKGTTIISADTAVQPSSMTAQYYASKKED